MPLSLFDGSEPTRVIGYANLSNIVRGVFWACHLGYAIDRQYQGRQVDHPVIIATDAYRLLEEARHHQEAGHEDEVQGEHTEVEALQGQVAQTAPDQAETGSHVHVLHAGSLRAWNQ